MASHSSASLARPSTHHGRSTAGARSEPKLINRGASSAAVPNIPPLPPGRAWTSHGTRFGRLPTPHLMSDRPSTSHIDLKMPRPITPGVAGLVAAQNAYQTDVLELLMTAPDELESARTAGSAGKKAPVPVRSHSRAEIKELQRQRSKREEVLAKAMSDIQRLTNERRSLVALDGRPVAEVPAKQPTDKNLLANTAKQHVRKDHDDEEKLAAKRDEARKLAMARTATGRVNARLEALREDDNARNELEMKCEEWKKTRSTGIVETRSFIKENAKLTRTLSMDVVLAKRKVSAAEWEVKRGLVQRRLHAMESEREVLRVTLERQLLKEQMEAGMLMPRGEKNPHSTARPQTAANNGRDTRDADDTVGEQHTTPGGEPLAVALNKLPPRERAQILRLEMERRRRWAALVLLGARASHSLDELVYARNNKHLQDEQHDAARKIQKKVSAKALRKGLEQLNRSMGCLRKNCGIFALRWKIRNKVRSGDTIRSFLRYTATKSGMAKTIHNFIYQVIRLQRAWRYYTSIMRAQLGVFSLQFDKLLHTKKSPDRFLNAGEKSLFLAKVSVQLLEFSEKDTRKGQLAAKRAANAPAATGGKKTDAAKKGTGAAAAAKDGGDAEADEELAKKLPALADGQFLQIDFDCKLKALSNKLLDRKYEHRKNVNAYEMEVAQAEALVRKAKQMEAARAVAANAPAAEERKQEEVVFGQLDPRAAPVPAGGGSMPEAADGITDLAAQVGDFASMVRAKPPVRVSLTLNEEEVRQTIANALLMTADKINLGLPIDQHRSTTAAARKL